MKVCSKCKETKFFDMFSRDKTNKKDGYHNQCKACKKAYIEANKEKIAEKRKDYNEANKEKYLEYHRNYYHLNKERYAQHSKSYRENNNNSILERNSRRRAMKIKAIPKFLRNCEVEKKRLQYTYKLRNLISEATGIEHHVDHMWPLAKGGPHWSGNLQIITATENLSKNDKLCKTLKKNIKDSLRIAKEEYTNEDNCNGHRD